ncbi:nitrate reductase 2 alpha subunit [Profundibacterium mesophilum KAUST100406-0324]|uniref:Nitrate reductase 2 alpha subunit n=2 Tax=Profundibacterium TaxID=1258570 RepID=A0A921TBR1_9RHOB|nr:nitrate reductase 2 alpha subunit [Profundibacterium mesophilum KAUST100406-0324]
MRRADTIAEELEEMIFTGSYDNGDRLDEIRLAERFGVSRTPVREALQKLSVSGLVEQIPHRGVFVRQPGPVELLEMFEVMAELEGACGRLAASRIESDALDRLAVANETCATVAKVGDADAYYRANEGFHHLIYMQSGNGFLEAETRRLCRRLQPFRRLQLRLRGRMEQSLSEHDGILEALRDGDSERSGSLLREHVAVQGEKFHHLMIGLRAEHKLV